MSNRYRTLDQTTATSNNVVLVNINYNAASVYGAQSFTAGVTKKLMAIQMQLTKAGSPIGNIYAEIYSGGTFGSGSLLSTTDSFDVSVALSNTTVDLSLIVPFDQTAASQYWIKIIGTWTQSTINYVAVRGLSTSDTYAGGKAGKYNGSTWDDVNYDLLIRTYTNADGGAYALDSNGSGDATCIQDPTNCITYADILALKGGVAPSATDIGYVYNGKTRFFNQNNETFKYWKIGDSDTGAAPSGQKSGFLEQKYGVNLIYAGGTNADDTTNFSGLLCNPTTPGTESKASKIIINGTEAQPCSSDNVGGALNTAQRHTIKVPYGQVKATYYNANHTFGHVFTGIAVDSTKTDNAPVINNVVPTAFGVLPSNVINIANVAIDLALNFRRNTATWAGLAGGVNNIFGIWGGTSNKLITGGSIAKNDWKFTGPDTGTGPQSVFVLYNIASDVYDNGDTISLLDIRNTQVVPLNVTLTNLQNGTCKVEVSNIASVSANDDLCLFLSDGTPLYKISKAKYIGVHSELGEKPANCGIIATLTIDMLHSGIYAKYSTNNITFSAASAPANDVTITFLPPANKVLINTGYGQNGTKYLGTLPAGNAPPLIKTIDTGLN